jgi:hypothetical protein
MVTHVTDVKPLAAVLTYLDQDSNTEVYQEVRGLEGLGGERHKFLLVLCDCICKG